MNYELLKDLEGKVVKVDRHGPNAAVGFLVHVGEDFFILLTKKDGVVIYQTSHVKSVTHDAKDELELDLTVPEDFECMTGDTFQDVLAQLIFHWIKVNPEKIEGVLDAVTDDYITIINKNEIIHVSLFHIRNVSDGIFIGNEEEDNNGKGNGNGKSRRRRRG